MTVGVAVPGTFWGCGFAGVLQVMVGDVVTIWHLVRSLVWPQARKSVMITYMVAIVVSGMAFGMVAGMSVGHGCLI